VPEELSPSARVVYDAITGGARSKGPKYFQLVDDHGRLEGPFNAMLLAPTIGNAVQALGAAIRFQSTLTEREREVAILVVAVAAGSNFEWYAHAPIAQANGLTDDELSQIKHGTCPSSLPGRERLVYQVTSELVSQRRLHDVDFDLAVSQLSEQTLVELVYLVGYYELLDLSLRAFRTPLPEGVPSPFSSLSEGGTAT